MVRVWERLNEDTPDQREEVVERGVLRMEVVAKGDEAREL